MVRKVYGSKSVGVTVGAASSRALPNNPNRSKLWVSSPSAGTVSLAFGETAVLNTGLTLKDTDHGQWLTYEELGERIHDSVFIIGSGAATVGMVDTDGDCPCME